MAGLFIIFGAAAALSLGLAAAQRLRASHTPLRVGPAARGGAVEKPLPISHAMTEGDMLRELVEGMRLLRSPAAMDRLGREELDAVVKLQAVVRGRHARDKLQQPSEKKAVVGGAIAMKEIP